VFVVKEKGHDFERQVDVVFNRMVRTTDHFLSVRIDIGVSTMHKDFRQLGPAYEEAAKALAYSRFGNSSYISYFHQMGDREARLVRFNDSDAKGLEHALRYGNEAEIARYIATLKEDASRDAGDTGNLNLYVINLVGMLANYAASIGVDINELSGTDILDLMLRIRSIDQLFDWVSGIAALIRERSVASKANNAQRLLDLATTTIHKSYADPELTMDGLCDQLGISPSYLGQLFRRNLDSSFVKFLTGVRMEKAKQLLTSTGDRIVEVANQCGYNDVYYFSHSFKKHTGSSPKKYREENA